MQKPQERMLCTYMHSSYDIVEKLNQFKFAHAKKKKVARLRLWACNEVRNSFILLIFNRTFNIGVIPILSRLGQSIYRNFSPTWSFNTFISLLSILVQLFRNDESTRPPPPSLTRTLILLFHIIP